MTPHDSTRCAAVQFCECPPHLASKCHFRVSDECIAAHGPIASSEPVGAVDADTAETIAVMNEARDTIRSLREQVATLTVDNNAMKASLKDFERVFLANQRKMVDLEAALARATPGEGSVVEYEQAVTTLGAFLVGKLTGEQWGEIAPLVENVAKAADSLVRRTTPPRSPVTVTEEVATDLSECERLASEIRHWVDDTVPQPALALMLSAMHNLEQAAAALGGRDA
jgi:hypothetical protein